MTKFPFNVNKGEPLKLNCLMDKKGKDVREGIQGYV